MKLYTDHQGTWVGTKKEIKELWGVTNSILISTDYAVEVPTDKLNLLKFLNDRRVIDFDAFIETAEPTPVRERHPLSSSADPKWYDVRDSVLNCDRKDLGAALTAIISRLYDEVECI